MLFSQLGLHRYTTRALPFCAQLCLAGIAAGAQAGTSAWLAVLLLGVISIAAWLGALRTLHTISATPLSRIASAAQGYVALQGRGRALAGVPLLSPYNGLPVLWYRLHIEERDGDGAWQSVNQDQSDACLLLEDDSGRCAIDPHDADVHTAQRETETRGDMRYTHWCLTEHTPLFVLGEFHTLQGETLNQTERETIKQILADWKHDRPELLRRFDLNGDGDLSEEEWELARSEAGREARRQRIEADQAAALHMVKQPRDSRPFLISAVKPWRLKLPHRAWCVWHAAMFLVSCIAIAMLQQTGTLALP
ncbi:hypothetical protein VVD49_16065 [Uliginosibacterium sp. H3]|uniref:EF-hand domain-containing protein n=1 Tax=Uliginosibacterium silvisoli TaxID=3114758 RepID=A0ABU6K6M9_9RHOO|nr:hypothetical protein [Uliginosibacterium sp. H3]